MADIAVPGGGDDRGMIDSYAGQVGSGPPVKREEEGMRSAAWDEFGQLRYRQVSLSSKPDSSATERSRLLLHTDRTQSRLPT
jgi:hypothetical protein